MWVELSNWEAAEMELNNNLGLLTPDIFLILPVTPALFHIQELPRGGWSGASLASAMVRSSDKHKRHIVFQEQWGRTLVNTSVPPFLEPSVNLGKLLHLSWSHLYPKVVKIKGNNAPTHTLS